MKHNILYIVLISLLNFGCSNYLDLKPDAKMAVPKTLEDCELLLNDYNSLNTGYPTLGEIAADDYYLEFSDWGSLSEYDERMTYIWSADIITQNTQWQNAYKTVYLSNQILDILQGLHHAVNENQYKKVLGAANFYRAFAFHQVARNFTMPYTDETAQYELGIPLRLSPDLDYKSVRSSLKESYDQIINGYEVAIKNLPMKEILKGRPDRAAAYAGLSRVYLDMQKYEKAYHYADSSLSIKNDLIDYAFLNPSDYLPIERFNKEVLFPAVTLYSSAIDQYYARIDKSLYDMYDKYDFRKHVYFEHQDYDDGTYAFKGSYDNSTGTPFIGLTTSEVYLIKAESAVRIDKVDEALIAINTLLKNRIDTDCFTPITESDGERLLKLILDERRKEMVFRGSRWADLKRLNQDDRFKKRLTRTLDGKTYSLEPNSLKYAHLIPDLVITESGMPQNKR